MPLVLALLVTPEVESSTSSERPLAGTITSRMPVPAWIEKWSVKKNSATRGSSMLNWNDPSDPFIAPAFRNPKLARSPTPRLACSDRAKL